MAAAAQAEDERAVRWTSCWRQRLERARYAADRARRQYQLAEPENRLVARQLEAEWESALAEAGRLEADYQRFTEEQPVTLTAAERAAIQRPGRRPPAGLARTDDHAGRPEGTAAHPHRGHHRERRRQTASWSTSPSPGPAATRPPGRAVRPVGRLDQLSYFPAMLARVTELAGAGRNSTADRRAS